MPPIRFSERSFFFNFGEMWMTMAGTGIIGLIVVYVLTPIIIFLMIATLVADIALAIHLLRMKFGKPSAISFLMTLFLVFGGATYIFLKYVEPNLKPEEIVLSYVGAGALAVIAFVCQRVF